MKKIFLKLFILLFFCGISFAQPAPTPVFNQASDIETNTSAFNNNLSGADTDVQKALDTIDNLSIGSGSGDVTDVGDCNGPACFTGTEGNTLTFKGATSGTIALKPADVAGTNTQTLKAETGNICTDASVCSGYQASLTTGNLTAVSPLSFDNTRQVISGAAAVSIANAAADGSTKGAASFTAADFNSSSGNISIDYANGQEATSGQDGFLSSTDWSTFNSKVSTSRLLTAGAGLSGGGDLSADRTFATASSEADFLLSGALTCGANTQGKMQVHTTPLQYCDNAATPTLRYAAYGNSSGESTAAANDSVALTTDTTGNYLAGLTAGTAIDVGASGEGASPQIDFDSTEITDTTFGDASTGSVVFRSNLSGATDPTLTFGNNLITFSHDIEITGNNIEATTETDRFVFMANGSTYAPEAIDLGTDTTGNYAAGDAEAGNATGVACTDCVALTTETSGNYVASVADGTGIDGTAAGEGATYTPTFDSTELEALTWGAGGNASNVWTFNLSGTDHTMTAGSGIMTFSHDIGILGDNIEATTETDRFVFMANGSTYAPEAINLGTDTTGNYANGDGEAGNALTGDSATAFFSSGQIERARGGTGADTSAYGNGIIGSDSGNSTIDIDTIAEIETAIGGSTNILTETEIDASSELAALMDDETGTAGALVFSNNPTLDGGSGTGATIKSTGTKTLSLYTGGTSETAWYGTVLGYPGFVAPAAGSIFFGMDNASQFILLTGGTTSYFATTNSFTGTILVGTNIDLNGTPLYLDADGDSRIQEVSDDKIAYYTNGAAIFQIDNTQIETLGTAPTLTSCGTSPSISSSATDMGGKVTVGTSASACTVTFAATWGNAPSCAVTSAVNAIQLSATTTTTTLVIDSDSDVSSIGFMYICFGQE